MKKIIFLMTIINVAMPLLHAQENGIGTLIMTAAPKPGININDGIYDASGQLIILCQDGTVNAIDNNLKLDRQILKTSVNANSIDIISDLLAIGVKGETNEYKKDYNGVYRQTGTKYGMFQGEIKTIHYSRDRDNTYLFGADATGNSRVYLRFDKRSENPEHGSLVLPRINTNRSVINKIIPGSGNRVIFLSNKIYSTEWIWNTSSNFSSSDEIVELKKPEIKANSEEVLLDKAAKTGAITPDKKILYYVPESEQQKIYRLDIAAKTSKLFFDNGAPVKALATDGMNIAAMHDDKISLIREEFGTIRISAKDDLALTYTYFDIYGPKNINSNIQKGKTQEFIVPPGKYTVRSSSASLNINPQIFTLLHKDAVSIEFTRSYPMRLIAHGILTPGQTAISPNGKFECLTVNPTEEQTVFFVMDTSSYKEVYRKTFFSRQCTFLFNYDDELVIIKNDQLHFFDKQGKEKTVFSAGENIQKAAVFPSNKLLISAGRRIVYISSDGNEIRSLENSFDINLMNILGEQRFFVKDSKRNMVYYIDNNNNFSLQNLIPVSFFPGQTISLFSIGKNGFGCVNTENRFYSWDGTVENIEEPYISTFPNSYRYEKNIISKNHYLLFFYDAKNTKLLGYDMASPNIAASRPVKEINRLKDILNIAGNDFRIIATDINQRVNVYNASYYGTFNHSGYYQIFEDLSFVFILPGEEESNDRFVPSSQNFDFKKNLFVERNKERIELTDDVIKLLQK
jgi:hypothetical protein